MFLTMESVDRLATTRSAADIISRLLLGHSTDFERDPLAAYYDFIRPT